MKKIPLFWTLAIICLGVPAQGQTIAVSSPAAGATWCIGAPVTVTWARYGSMPDTVAIRLRRAGSGDSDAAAWNLTSSTANDGSFGPVVVPASVPEGEYFIRVRTSDPNVGDDSGIFHVGQCAAIAVTQPAGNTWRKGRTYEITWTKSGPMPDLVRIGVAPAPYSPGQIAYLIVGSTANDLSYSWNIQEPLAPGDYVVLINTLGTEPVVPGVSSAFKIAPPLAIRPGIPAEMAALCLWIEPPTPGPDPWWNIDARPWLEILRRHGEDFTGSLFLSRNGRKLQEIGEIGKGHRLPGRLKFKTGPGTGFAPGREGTGFSLLVCDPQGERLYEIPLKFKPAK